MFVNLLGSCNGLVCLAIGDSDDYAGIILWNPSTGDTTLFYGLGYDSYNEDYKVILGSRDTTETNPFQTATNVFTLKTNSWTTYQEEEINFLKGKGCAGLLLKWSSSLGTT
ncbi:F-box protein [Pyrus ussuriensis x Pyrus communis]|uniref:F-box protein n=1 Tax=Pyrus ussuriensis x Pyrus communis TaxID=2448454 RepID=A0A5N5FGV6_9ROSA|nr:F-box protein [Pyrus ussuriensis x Pyrus communis]